jgi:hypothetical protein
MTKGMVLFGAGASIEFGAPSTPCLTDTIAREVHADRFLRSVGGDKAYHVIADGLGKYLSAKVNLSRSIIACTNWRF